MRSLTIQAALASAALIAAYFTWQRPKETSTAESVVVMEATKQALEKIHFDDGTRFMELVRRVEGEPVTWLTQGFLPGKAPTFDAGPSTPLGVNGLDGGLSAPGRDGGPSTRDGGIDAGIPKPPMPQLHPVDPPPTRELRGNERADALWNRFAPLEAARLLGVLDATKLQELGLTDSTRTLDVTVAGTVRTFKVSKPLPGIIGTYLLDTKSNQVSLMQGSLFTELDPSSTALVDRRLHLFKQLEVERFTVTIGDKSVEFTQKTATLPAVVARTASPDKPDEMAKNWSDKIWSRVIVTDVLGKDEQPKKGPPKVEMRIDYVVRGGKRGFLEVAFDSTQATFVRTENCASWFAVHQGAEELLIEGKQLLRQ